MILLKMSMPELSEMASAFRGNPGALTRAMQDGKGNVISALKDATPKGKTGKLAAGWHGQFVADRGASGRFERGSSMLFINEVPYGYVLEEGRYRGVGPRTVQTGSGIFSTQAPQGITAGFDGESGVVGKIFDGVVEDLMDGLYGR